MKTYFLTFDRWLNLLVNEVFDKYFDRFFEHNYYKPVLYIFQNKNTLYIEFIRRIILPGEFNSKLTD